MGRAYRHAIAACALVGIVGCFVENIPGAHCNTSSDCSDPYPVCDTARHACSRGGSGGTGGGGGDMGGGDMNPPVACTSSSMCPATAPTCSAQGLCVGCSPVGMSSDCATFHAATPLCGMSGGCVECNTNDNCDQRHLTCDPMTFTCVSCKKNADCTSGVCNPTNGLCVDESMMLYVNNAPTAGCSQTGAGLFSAPFCTVQRGMDAAAAAGKPLVVFAGSGYREALQANYMLNANNNYVVSIIGNGNPAIQPAGTGPVLNVLGNGAAKQVTVTFDGFTFDGAQLTDGSDAIDCAGGGSNYGGTLLNLYRSTIRGSSAIGVSSTTKCVIALDSDLIRDNKGGAIRVDTTDFALTNLLLLSNGAATNGGTAGSSFGGIYESNAGEVGKMTIANLTLVGNKADNNAAASAMQCQIAAPKTINTVVFGNTGPATEVQTACVASLTYSAYVGAGTNTMNNLDLNGCTAAQLFVNAGNSDYVPVKGGTKPCTLVDVGTNTGAPPNDYAGTPRPQPYPGGVDDIGAYEAQ